MHAFKTHSENTKFLKARDAWIVNHAPWDSEDKVE